MKTTVEIDDPIFKQIKRLSTDEERSMRSLIGELLQLGLAVRREEGGSQEFDWQTKKMGVKIPIEDKDHIAAILDQS